MSTKTGTKAEQLIEAVVTGEDTPVNLIEAISTYIYHWRKDVDDGMYSMCNPVIEDSIERFHKYNPDKSVSFAESIDEKKKKEKFTVISFSGVAKKEHGAADTVRIAIQLADRKVTNKYINVDIRGEYTSDGTY